MYKGAGSGMAGMAAAIPIQNLVWRRHTNQKYSGELFYQLVPYKYTDECTD